MKHYHLENNSEVTLLGNVLANKQTMTSHREGLFI